MNNFKDNFLAKTLAILLSIVMCVTILPVNALADGTGGGYN